MLDRGSRNTLDNVASFGLGPSIMGTSWDGSKPQQQKQAPQTDYSQYFKPLYQSEVQTQNQTIK